MHTRRALYFTLNTVRFGAQIVLTKPGDISDRLAGEGGEGGPLRGEALSARLDAAEALIKSVYCELPNYEAQPTADYWLLIRDTTDCWLLTAHCILLTAYCRALKA